MDLQYFRNILRKKLQEKNMTLNTLSLQADLSEDTLRSIIYGKSQDIKLSTLIKIADVLNCSLDDLVGRSLYSKQQQNIIKQLFHLPDRSIHTIQFIIGLEESTALQKSTQGREFLRILLPTGNMKDGMFYDNSTYEELDITEYPYVIKQNADIGIKILSQHYEPVYYPNDILLLSHKRLPVYNDTVLYIDNDGKFYIRKYLETGLESINGIGKRISPHDQTKYKAMGVVIKVVKEFNVEQYR